MDISSVTNSQNSTGLMGNTQSRTEAKEAEVAKPVEKADLKPKTTTEMNKENEEEIKKKLTEAVDDLNSQMDMLNTNIKFGFNDKIDIMYVDVHEKSSGKLIRKFPSEEAMRLAEHMKEFVGILFDKKG